MVELAQIPRRLPASPVPLTTSHKTKLYHPSTNTHHPTMKEDIRKMLEDILPLVDFDSEFLFAELDSLGITAILMTLSKAYDIDLESPDVTPKNFKNLDSLVNLVKTKIAEKNNG